MKGYLNNIVSTVIIVVICFSFTSCQNEKNPNKFETLEEPEHTLAGIWNTDSYTVKSAISDELAKEMKDDWLNTETFFRITDTRLLYVDDKYNNTWPAYTLSIDEELDGNRMKISANGDPTYVKMTLYWDIDNDKLTCLYTNNAAVVVVELSKSK